LPSLPFIPILSDNSKFRIREFKQRAAKFFVPSNLRERNINRESTPGWPFQKGCGDGQARFRQCAIVLIQTSLNAIVRQTWCVLKFKSCQTTVLYIIGERDTVLAISQAHHPNIVEIDTWIELMPL
jgi:hypothetical protein